MQCRFALIGGGPKLDLDGADFSGGSGAGAHTEAYQDALREAAAHRITVVPTLITEGHTRRSAGVPAETST